MNTSLVLRGELSQLIAAAHIVYEPSYAEQHLGIAFTTCIKNAYVIALRAGVLFFRG